MVSNEKGSFKSAIFNLTVLIAGLGYFVDMFDLTLFGVIRVQSLQALGITSPEDMLKVGIDLYNAQMIGMMIGGVVWGILTDKKGRLSVMFASIFLYSFGNIANAFVTSETAYWWCRLLTGFGLAGELGAAITLVAENLPVESRGWGTTIVATLGLLGAATAALVGQKLHWQTAYLLGGGMGILLLVSRFKLTDSEIFQKAREAGQSQMGKWQLLFEPKRFKLYLSCILVGAPIYMMTGILFTFAPEITQNMGLDTPLTAGNALLAGTLGLTLGDLVSGTLSQLMKSRKKVLLLFLSVTFLLCLFYMSGLIKTTAILTGLCFFIGVGAGYWAVLITTSSEQFGTNIRGTVSSTVPNFVRGFAVIITLTFKFLKTHFTTQEAVLTLIVCVFGLAYIGLRNLKETHGVSLDFYEKD
jgi:MFS transporter, putative metabolite:H+ symporter